MRFESCLAVLTSLVLFAVGSNDGDDTGNIKRILAGHGEIRRLKHHEYKKNSSDDATEKRSKSSLSYSDRNTVLYNFNYQRSLVGASDMNYLDYDTAFEVDLSNWTRRCNYDGDFYSRYGSYIFTVYGDYPNHAKEIQNIFSNRTTNVFYGLRSIYVTGVAGSVDYCSRLTVNRTIHSGAYLIVYGYLINRSLYNEAVQQYTKGPACTRCQSNVAWCYNNKLCRDDCSFSIYGCCKISNGAQTANCATTLAPPTTPTPATTIATIATSGSRKDQVVGTAMLYGLLFILRYCFQ